MGGQWWHLIPGEPGGVVIDVLESDDGRGSAGQAISRHVRHLQGQIVHGDNLGMTAWGRDTERAQAQVRSGPPAGSVDPGEPGGWQRPHVAPGTLPAPKPLRVQWQRCQTLDSAQPWSVTKQMSIYRAPAAAGCWVPAIVEREMDEGHLTQQVTRQSHTGETKKGFLEVRALHGSPAARGSSGPDRGWPSLQSMSGRRGVPEVTSPTA